MHRDKWKSSIEAFLPFLPTFSCPESCPTFPQKSPWSWHTSICFPPATHFTPSQCLLPIQARQMLKLSKVGFILGMLVIPLIILEALSAWWSVIWYCLQNTSFYSWVDLHSCSWPPRINQSRTQWKYRCRALEMYSTDYLWLLWASSSDFSLSSSSSGTWQIPGRKPNRHTMRRSIICCLCCAVQSKQ